MTPQEEALVLAHRKVRDRDLAADVLLLVVMRVGFEYQNWLNENGAGSTYTTFCDEFGYPAEGLPQILTSAGIDRPLIFNLVGLLRVQARDLTRQALEQRQAR
jgi:hypothetical protein